MTFQRSDTLGNTAPPSPACVILSFFRQDLPKGKPKLVKSRRHRGRGVRPMRGGPSVVPRPRGGGGTLRDARAGGQPARFLSRGRRSCGAAASTWPVRRGRTRCYLISVPRPHVVHRMALERSKRRGDCLCCARGLAQSSFDARRGRARVEGWETGKLLRWLATTAQMLAEYQTLPALGREAPGSGGEALPFEGGGGIGSGNGNGSGRRMGGSEAAGYLARARLQA